ncbi:unnamed protein product [Ranitomeya imitator]|uniref:Reverse transcriptase domain-containing protein n=1 Tax=Ranitomeya imitator TaxID=111125 RepID=A0ABN9M421_9NEOB|nr:unnamed protein product [Ranitomeya imitator]
MSKESLESWFKELGKDVDKWEEDVSGGKLKKFIRDNKDYETCKVYKWQQRKMDIPSQQVGTDISDVSSASGSESGRSSNETTYNRDFHLRSGRRKYADIFQRPKGPRKARDTMKVLNLSKHSLTKAQIDLLEKGLTFSPSTPLDPFIAIKDLNLFARKIILKKLHFKPAGCDPTTSTTMEDREVVEILESLETEQQGVSMVPSNLFVKSKNFPALNLCPAVEVFTRLVSNEIQTIAQSQRYKNNLSKEERMALEELRSWDDVVYKPADKGGNLVVWPVDMYVRQAHKLLKNETCYKRLVSNPTALFQQELIVILERAYDDGLITKTFLDRIRDFQPKLATFYLIPKVHKNALDPPGRPIVARIGGLCEIIADVVDYFLKPIVSTLPSFVRDTTQALQRIDQLQLDENQVLVTADIEALYTSIRHSDGLAATAWFLRTSNIENSLADLILILLEFVLRHNVFIFDKNIYLQTQGTAMGASCAPSYANLFLGAWERDIFLGEAIPEMGQVQNWMRYIDDVMFVWEGDEEGLETLMRKLNDNKINVKLTFKSGRCLEFLDIWVETASDGSVCTDVFRKPTSTNSYLHAESSHPVSTIRGIPIGQFLRVKRICSNDILFEKQCEELTRRFEDRGYSRRMIRRGYRRAKSTTRNELLYTNKIKERKDEKQVRFISTFNGQWNNLKDLICKHWKVLLTDPVLKQVLPQAPQCVARRSANMKDLLVHSHYNPKRPLLGSDLSPGFFPCGLCKACLNLDKSKHFFNAEGTRRYDIRKHLTCSSKEVIYQATCPCGKIYIGLTTREFKIRVREHILDIEKAASVGDDTLLKTLPRHFKRHHNCKSRGLRFKAIDQLDLGVRGGDTSRMLAQLECRWIFRLSAMSPVGLNENMGFSAFL